MKVYILSSNRTGNICNYMLADLEDLPQVHFVYQDLWRCTFRNRYIRKLARLSAQALWAVRKKRLVQKLYSENESVTVLITNEAMQWLSVGDLQKLQAAGADVCALLIDPISGNYPSAACARRLIETFPFRRILTFDPEDARNHDWTYCNTLYSKCAVAPRQVKYDLFYVGTVKNRIQACRQILELTKSNGVNACIKLLCFDRESARQLPTEAVMESYVPYPQLLEMMQDACCIFDMTQNGQTGVTLRYYEAVVYNKKLLTNNMHIKELPYYDSRYMRIYERFEDIDWDWVKDTTMPDYGYDGRFSPVNILQLLKDSEV